MSWYIDQLTHGESEAPWIKSSFLGPKSSTSSLRSLLSCDREDLPPFLFTTQEYFVIKVKRELMEMRNGSASRHS